jgi:hypothetical protein
MILDLNWEWGRAHRYELGTASGEQVIQQIGRGRDRIRPLGEQRKRPAYLEFATLDASPEACLAFASSWGLLISPPRDGAAEPLDLWRKEIKSLNRLVNVVPGAIITANSRRTSMKITKLEVGLISGDPGRHPMLMIQPETLLSAMLLQFAQAQAGGASVRACAQCGQWFEIGGRGATRKRSMAQFCSISCRMRHHYERSRQAG